jgi:hypothetical protein
VKKVANPPAADPREAATP